MSTLTVDQGTCFQLSNATTACPEIGFARVEGINDLFYDTDSFDKYYWTQVSSFTSSDVRKAFSQSYDCPGYAASVPLVSQRYQQSYYCSMVLQNAVKKCIQQYSYVPLCLDTCNSAAQSLQTIFSDPALCTADSPFQNNRDSVLTSYTNTCSGLTVANPSAGRCLNGSHAEEYYSCGFGTVTEATAYCKTPSGKGDVCCASVSQPAASSKSWLTKTFGSDLNGGLVFGGISLFVLILIAVAIYFVSKKEREKRESQNAQMYQQSYDKQDSKNLPERPFSVVTDGASVTGRQTLDLSRHSGAKYTVNGASPMVDFIDSANPNRKSTASAKAATFNSLIGTTANVVAGYTATLPDELTLNVGETVLVIEAFDDGWAYGKHLGTGASGVYPLTCLEIVDTRVSALLAPAGKASPRLSSMWN